MTVQGAKTLDSGLGLLWALREHPDGLPIGQLAGVVGLDRNAVRRMLTVLSAHRLVTRTGEGCYRLGLGAVELAAATRPRLQAAAAEALRRLAADSGATAFITALDHDNDGEQAVVVDVVEPPRSLMHVAYRVGLRHRLDQGAAGVALLAGSTPCPAERDLVTRARSAGFAVTVGELQEGMWGLAAPIVVAGRTVDSSVGVVSIGALDQETTATIVRRAARDIADALSR